MNDRSFGEVDEAAIERFEHDWLNGRSPDLQDYLPDEASDGYAETLEELAHIDLEFRCKELAESSTESEFPSARDYWQRFPALLPVAEGLIQAEFDLAIRAGRSIEVNDLVRRYQDVGDAERLAWLLQQQKRTREEQTSLQAGHRLDRYEIEAQHGRGGFGAVWRANDTKLGRRIAVKQLGQQLARDNQFRRRFISEARITAKLEHPGIVPVYDMSGVDEAYAYYTMRLIQGQTMAEAIERLHSLDSRSPEYEMLQQRLLRAFVDVCETIQYAHSRGVVHRDLKPHNVVLGDFGETILLDWGLAGRFESTAVSASSLSDDTEILSPEESVETLSGAVSGTPAYMSPEQANGHFESVGTASDIYSLGAMLYHMISGKVPFTDGPLDQLLERVRKGDLDPAHQRHSSAPLALSAVAAKAMKLDPVQRYGTVRELTNDIQRYMADQPVSVYHDPLTVQFVRWVRKNPTTAASAVLTGLFLLITITVGYAIWDFWKQREESRIGELRVAAEKADTAALNQIHNNRFEAAERTLAQALALTTSESDLAEIHDRLRTRHQRTHQIVRFYDLSRQAQEATFFDQIHRSSMYCQAALQELDVLNHPDWWAHLPQDDLTSRQRDQLRTEIYRVIGLLASMRLAETANQQFSLGIFFRGLQGQEDSFDVTPLLAAAHAAQIGNAYRTSRAMNLIVDLKQWLVDDAQENILLDMNPTNPIDAAIMGSILDNNQPDDLLTRTALRGILEGRDPGAVAQSWLDTSLQYNPEWYWLAIFMGTSEVREGDYATSLKAFTHAIGIQPDYWVGYQYRAAASVLLARSVSTEEERNMLLNSALHDLQRAFDLSQTHSDPYWTSSLVLSELQAAPAQVIAEFLRALSLHHRLDQLPEGHYSGISRLWFAEAKRYVTYLQSIDNEIPELVQLEMALAVWEKDYPAALELATGLSSDQAENPNVVALYSIAQAATGGLSPSDQERLIQLLDQSTFAWSAGHALAIQYLNEQRWDEAQAILASNLDRRADHWQRALTHAALAEALLSQGETPLAVEQFQLAIQEDLAVDLQRLSDAAQRTDAVPMLAVLEVHQETLRPIIQDTPAVIARPALMNGDFELGLSFYWSPFNRRTQQGAFNRFGGSQAIAEVVSTHAHSGERSLWIMNRKSPEGSSAELSQQCPVTPGQRYAVRLWCQADALQPGAVQVSIAGETPTVFDVPGGTYDWSEQIFEFEALESTAELRIRSLGDGQVWFDDLTIEQLPAH